MPTEKPECLSRLYSLSENTPQGILFSYNDFLKKFASSQDEYEVLFGENPASSVDQIQVLKLWIERDKESLTTPFSQELIAQLDFFSDVAIPDFFQALATIFCKRGPKQLSEVLKRFQVLKTQGHLSYFWQSYFYKGYTFSDDWIESLEMFDQLMLLGDADLKLWWIILERGQTEVTEIYPSDFSVHARAYIEFIRRMKDIFKTTSLSWPDLSHTTFQEFRSIQVLLDSLLLLLENALDKDEQLAAFSEMELGLLSYEVDGLSDRMRLVTEEMKLYYLPESERDLKSNIFEKIGQSQIRVHRIEKYRDVLIFFEEKLATQNTNTLVLNVFDRFVERSFSESCKSQDLLVLAQEFLNDLTELAQEFRKPLPKIVRHLFSPGLFLELSVLKRDVREALLQPKIDRKNSMDKLKPLLKERAYGSLRAAKIYGFSQRAESRFNISLQQQHQQEMSVSSQAKKRRLHILEHDQTADDTLINSQPKTEVVIFKATTFDDFYDIFDDNVQENDYNALYDGTNSLATSREKITILSKWLEVDLQGDKLLTPKVKQMLEGFSEYVHHRFFAGLSCIFLNYGVVGLAIALPRFERLRVEGRLDIFLESYFLTPEAFTYFLRKDTLDAFDSFMHLRSQAQGLWWQFLLKTKPSESIADFCHDAQAYLYFVGRVEEYATVWPTFENASFRSISIREILHLTLLMIRQAAFPQEQLEALGDMQLGIVPWEGYRLMSKDMFLLDDIGQAFRSLGLFSERLGYLKDYKDLYQKLKNNNPPLVANQLFCLIVSLTTGKKTALLPFDLLKFSDSLLALLQTETDSLLSMTDSILSIRVDYHSNLSIDTFIAILQEIREFPALLPEEVTRFFELSQQYGKHFLRKLRITLLNDEFSWKSFLRPELSEPENFFPENIYEYMRHHSQAGKEDLKKIQGLLKRAPDVSVGNLSFTFRDDNIDEFFNNFLGWMQNVESLKNLLKEKLKKDSDTYIQIIIKQLLPLFKKKKYQFRLSGAEESSVLSKFGTTFRKDYGTLLTILCHSVSALLFCNRKEINQKCHAALFSLEDPQDSQQSLPNFSEPIRDMVSWLLQLDKADWLEWLGGLGDKIFALLDWCDTWNLECDTEQLSCLLNHVESIIWEAQRVIKHVPFGKKSLLFCLKAFLPLLKGSHSEATYETLILGIEDDRVLEKIILILREIKTLLITINAPESNQDAFYQAIDQAEKHYQEILELLPSMTKIFTEFYSASLRAGSIETVPSDYRYLTVFFSQGFSSLHEERALKEWGDLDIPFIKMRFFLQQRFRVADEYFLQPLGSFLKDYEAIAKETNDLIKAIAVFKKSRPACHDPEVDYLLEMILAAYASLNSLEKILIILKKSEEYPKERQLSFIESELRLLTETLSDEDIPEEKIDGFLKELPPIESVNLAQASEKLDHVICLLKSEGLSFELRENIRASLAQLLQYADAHFSKENVQLVDSIQLLTKELQGRDYWEMDEQFLQWIALANTLLYRTTGIYLNTTQLISVLLCCDEQKDLLLQMQTGEGKSYVTAMLAALEWLRVGTVDVLSANRELIYQDYTQKRIRYFFEALNIPSCVLLPGKNMSYQAGTVYYTTPWDRSFVSSEQFLLTLDKRSLIPVAAVIDECDSLLLNMSGTMFNYVAIESPQNPWAWIYPLVIRFVELESFRNLDKLTGWSREEDINQLQSFLEQQGLTEAQKKQLHTLADRRLKLSYWIDAACFAHSQTEGVDYFIVEDHVRPGGHVAVPIVKDIPQIGAEYSQGVHCFLHVLCQRKHKDKIFHLPTDVSCLDTESPLGLTFRYKRMTGLSATLGTLDDQKYLLSQRGLIAFSIPSHTKSQNHQLPTEIYPSESEQFNAIKKHLKASKGRPVLIVEENLIHANRLYQKLERQGMKVQILLGTESAKESKHKLSEASKDGIITICMLMHARGMDLRPRHPDGLFVMVACLKEAELLRQAFGRAGRYGKKGQSLLILDASRYGLEKVVSLSLKEKERAISNVQKEVVITSAIERYYTQKVADIQTATLTLFDEIMRLVYETEKPDDQEAVKIELMQLRREWLEKLAFLWKQLLENSDPETRYHNPYVRKQSNGAYETQILDECLEKYSAEIEEAWTLFKQRLQTFLVRDKDDAKRDVFNFLKFDWLLDAKSMQEEIDCFRKKNRYQPTERKAVIWVAPSLNLRENDLAFSHSEELREPDCEPVAKSSCGSLEKELGEDNFVAQALETVIAHLEAASLETLEKNKQEAQACLDSYYSAYLAIHPTKDMQIAAAYIQQLSDGGGAAFGIIHRQLTHTKSTWSYFFSRPYLKRLVHEIDDLVTKALEESVDSLDLAQRASYFSEIIEKIQDPTLNTRWLFPWSRKIKKQLEEIVHLAEEEKKAIAIKIPSPMQYLIERDPCAPSNNETMVYWQHRGFDAKKISTKLNIEAEPIKHSQGFFHKANQSLEKSKQSLSQRILQIKTEKDKMLADCVKINQGYLALFRESFDSRKASALLSDDLRKLICDIAFSETLVPPPDDLRELISGIKENPDNKIARIWLPDDLAQLISDITMVEACTFDNDIIFDFKKAFVIEKREIEREIEKLHKDLTKAQAGPRKPLSSVVSSWFSSQPSAEALEGKIQELEKRLCECQKRFERERGHLLVRLQEESEDIFKVKEEEYRKTREALASKYDSAIHALEGELKSFDIKEQAIRQQLAIPSPEGIREGACVSLCSV